MTTGAAAVAIGTRADAQEPAALKLIQRAIPSSGEVLPAIGLGTWQTFGVGGSARERAPQEEVLKAFAELGGKVLDSSPMYGTAEEVVGDLSAKLALEGKFFLATKVWTRGKEQGIAQLEDSVKKLRTKVIDLVQVHNLVDLETQLATLREWKEAGRIRYLGVTHYTESGHDAVVKVIEKEPLDFVQINYSVGEEESAKTVLPAARAKGLGVIANRPFAGGELFSQVLKKPLPDFAKEIDCTSWAQLLLKWVIGHPDITCAIPATSKVKHLRDNMAACRGRLPDEELRGRIMQAAMA
jgi:diketogulonate reductase-like aldo/keto reductase